MKLQCVRKYVYKKYTTDIRFVHTKSMKKLRKNSIEASSIILLNTSEPKFRMRKVHTTKQIIEISSKKEKQIINLIFPMPSLMRLHLHKKTRETITISVGSLPTSLEVSAPNFSLQNRDFHPGLICSRYVRISHKQIFISMYATNPILFAGSIF
jgi:hypothetical protein